MAISEYDAFGPWIYEIDEDHPVPRLFVPHIPTDEPALMLFKIPRHIERRVATPDMDLYDYMVGAYSNHICILKRDEQNVIKTTVPYSEIECVSLKRHFLEGVLTLYLKKDTVTVPFNAVSMDMIKRFTSHIRSKNLSGQAIVPETVREKQMDIQLNLLFTNVLRDLRADGETPLLYAYQPVVDRVPVTKPGLQGLLNRFRHQKMPATLHILTPDELLVVKQDVATGKQSKEELIYHYFYLPITEVKNVELGKSGDYLERTCSISLPNHSLLFPVGEKNDSIDLFYELMKAYIR